MTAGAIIEPDLTGVLDDLRFEVMSLERIERQIVELDEVENYDRLGKMAFDRSDILDKIAIKAAKLAISPRALKLLVEQSNRMRTARKHQVPSLNALLSALEILRDAMARDTLEAATATKLARIKGSTRGGNTVSPMTDDETDHFEARSSRSSGMTPTQDVTAAAARAQRTSNRRRTN